MKQVALLVHVKLADQHWAYLVQTRRAWSRAVQPDGSMAGRDPELALPRDAECLARLDQGHRSSGYP
jgi:hypothetical protein